MDILNGLISGVVSGIISSFLFYQILRHIKVKIKVSDVICCQTDEAGNICYKVKVVNLSKLPLTKFFYTLQFIQIGQDKINTVQEIFPVKTKLTVIPRYSKKDTDYNYAARLTYKIPEDISSMKGNVKLTFSFCVDHPFSGTVTCVTKDYYKKDIVCGTFEKGTSMEYTSFRGKCVNLCDRKEDYCLLAKN